MNKKFLSAILFGALMVSSTGTFVSCKDYDDDIENLQEQIDKLATKEDMTSQIATLQAALTTAAKEASDALTKATAAETAAKAAADAAAEAKAAAEKSVAQAKAEAIAAVKAELDALKKQLTEATDSALKEMSQKVTEATKKVEKIVGEIADMVTSVELVKSFALGTNVDAIVLSTAQEKENVFSEGVENKITFVKNAEVQTPGKFLIRVSPANAVLKPEMISLVNSQGQNLDNLLKVVKVEKSKALLSKAATNNGLWEVSVQLKNYGDGKAFAAATTTKNGAEKVLFAAQVNNSQTTSEVRYATSSYDLTLDWEEFVGESNLNFFVDNKNIIHINNRFSNMSLSLQQQGTGTMYNELVWNSTVPAVAPITDPAKGEVNAKPGDDRHDREVYPAVQGKALKIALSTKGDKIVAPTNIRAIYVTLDKANAIESAPSELNAWNSYQYTGLNTVVEGTSTEIIINSKTAIDDVIGFRVYAVNFDGTLVDPDGKAFYVRLGNVAENWNVAATKITALTENGARTDKSEKVAVSLTKLTGAESATWTTDKIELESGKFQPAFNAVFEDAEGNVLYNTANVNTFAADFSKVAKVYTVPTRDEWTKYEDGKAYNGTLTIKNKNGHVIATMKVSMTKVLPEGIPAGFSVKTAQVSAGVYNCYMIPNNWAANQATEGTMAMTEVFNFGENTLLYNYEIKFADSEKANNKLQAKTVHGDGSLSVTKDFVDNATKHATTVVYNYGKISSVKNDKGEYVEVKRSAAEFQTIFNCIYNDTYKWDWATNEQAGTVGNVNYAEKDKKGNYVNALPSKELTYGTDYAFKADEFIFGTSAWDGIYSKKLSASYKNSLKIETATLTSDANGVAEYFEVELDADKHIVNFKAVQKSSTTNPTASVKSTLTIKAKDMYGHDIVIKLPMVVNKR